VSAATAPALGHRERLLAAMAASIEQKGYRETFVGDVVRIARTSRRSFYENFSDREDCFLALFDWTVDGVMAQVAAAVRAESPWEEQVDSALAAWLDSLAARPKLWTSFTRELPAAGQEGAARQHAGVLRFAELLVALVEAGRRRQPQLEAKSLTIEEAIIIVGGLRELAVTASEQGRDVRELRPLAARTVNAILDATS
jgi:AcrR family transcriptional regulator